MKRRRLIAIISLCTLAAIGLIVVIAGVVVMRTDTARNFVQARLQAAIDGQVYVGRISGNPLARLTVDSLSIRDKYGAVVVSTGKLEFDYDIRDLMDQRLYFRHVKVEHPLVHLRQDSLYQWNYKLLAKNRNASKPTVKASTWGDYFVIDSVRVVDGSFLLSQPWTPDDSLRGARRDSSIRFNLARKDHRIEKVRDGYSRTYIWTKMNGLLAHAHLADPDSTRRFGQDIDIARLDAVEFDPPFTFRNVRGTVQKKGDSAWIDVSHFDLPRSTGSAKGKIVWGSDRPVRYDLVVRGDSVALADINWVYPTLPKTGGGSMVLRITNKRNDRWMDYHIDSMDVRSTGSRLLGEMTFGVGGPVLQVRNVNLKADPVDFDLIETLSGKPLPVDWAGQIFGDVRAPGGPVTDFAVASMNGEWRDAHVRGAVSRVSGSGNLNIFAPAYTAFHDFDVNVKTLDLRSIEYLFPAFPRLNGTIAGRATLDSVWTDVRFRDADIFHRDGPGTPSHFTGSGRITDGSPYITYDVDLNANPISFDMLSRSFPGLTLRGLAYGPLKIKGQSPDLQVVTNLVSAAGNLRFAGNIDIDSLGGYGARGVGEIQNVNLARLGIKPNAAVTSLSGQYTLNVRGSTASSLVGSAQIRLDSSRYDRIRLDSASQATIRFDQGRAYIDSLIVRSPIGLFEGLGAIGLPGGASDSIKVTLTLDSLGGVRPFLDAAGIDTTLAGKLVVNGIATGRLDSLFVRGTVISADTLSVRGITTKRLTGEFSFNDVLRAPSGSFRARLDSLRVGGLRFDTANVTFDLLDSTHATFAVNGRRYAGDSLRLNALGRWASMSGTTLVGLDSFALGFGASQWNLERPATLTTDSATVFSLDSLSLRRSGGGAIGLAGVVPVSGPVDLRLSSSKVPLFDIDRVLGRLQAPVSGVADLSAHVTGTKDSPLIDANAALDSIAISNVQIGRLIGTGRYANNQASANADIFQGDRRVLHAVADSLPLAVRLFGYDTLPGRLRMTASAADADFTLVQAWIDMVSHVTGKISGNLSLDGTWRKPNIVADARLTDGAMRIDTLGIALSKMFGRVSYSNDSLKLLEPLRLQSGGDDNTAQLSGFVTFKDWRPDTLHLDMAMNNFLAYNRPELATIYARTAAGNPVTLRGTLSRDTLRGEVFVEQGSIYLPDPKLVGKRFLAIDSLQFVGGTRDSTLYERATANIFTDLTAHIGGSFALSADYANIPLTGDLQIVPVTATDVARRAGDYVSRLAPLGTINADRGTYSLQIPPIFSKSFEVQRGGTITFDRDAQWNGILNVSARYTVRKPGRPEIPIVIDVTDRLLTPKVTPRSEASFPISNSDLISYIVTGEPGWFDQFGQASGTNTGGAEALLSSLFAPIATSATADLLRQRMSKTGIDVLRFESIGGAQASQADLGSRSYRVTGGWEVLSGKGLLSVSAGVCGLSQRQSNAPGTALVNQFGGNFEYRLRSSLSSGATWQVGLEPSTVALLCSPGTSSSGFGITPTPRQLSLSFLQFWRW